MRKALLCAALAAICAGFAGPALAQQPLGGNELRQTVVGKTVYLRVFGFELPISYRGDGTMVAAARGAAQAATTRGEPHRDRGRWWIDDDRLCQQWDRWMGARAYCFTLSRSGDRVTWVRNDGRRGTARLGG